MGLAIELVRYRVNSNLDRIDHLIQQDIYIMSGGGQRKQRSLSCKQEMTSWER